jgi:hypothetical protein
MFEDFKKLIANLSESQKSAENDLEGRSFEVDTFSIETINKILLINSDLKKMTVGLDVENALEIVQGYLNSLSWKTRFRTGESGKPESDRDSIYYVTPENISLRLKLSNRVSGDMSKVIQPFMEKIVFEDDANVIFTDPVIGLTPQEYSSPEFMALQDRDGVDHEFVSEIKQYKDESGKILLIKKAQGGCEHTGSKINIVL